MHPHSNAISGNCPQGCGRTLYRTPQGIVRCSDEDCPDPDSVHKLLADDETEHVVEIGEEHFMLQHPLREHRDLFGCDVHQRIAALGGPPVEPGRWRVRVSKPDGYSESSRGDATGLEFERLESADA